MDKKGFTLVELLAVIVLLGVVMLIATVSVTGVRNKINISALYDKLELILPSAEEYAENKLDLYNEYDGMTIDGYSVKAKTITIEQLINNGYLENGETNVTNPIDKSSLNNLQIIVYLLRDRTFACIPTNSYALSYNSNDNYLKGSSNYSIDDLELDSLLCKN